MRRPGQQGFTLLELIVAFTILALLAGLVFSSLRLSLNSYEKSQDRLEEEARRRVLFDQLRRQIGSLYPLRPTGGFLDAPMDQNVANPVEQIAMAQAPLFSGEADSVTFITVAPLFLQTNPGLTVTRYGLAQDELGHYYLGAMETRYTGLESFVSMVWSTTDKPLPLVESVDTLEFSYYGFDPRVQAYGWTLQWNGNEMLGVPEAIRIGYNGRNVVIPINASVVDNAQLRQMNPTVGF